MALSGAHPDRQIHLDTSAFFDQTGDGTGNIHMNVDGSVTPVDFSFTCPPNTTMQFSSFCISIIDGGMYADKYGGITKLTNGTVGFVEIAAYGGYRVNFFDKQPIVSNAAFLSYGNYEYMDFGQGDSGLKMTYVMTPATFNIFPGDRAGICVQDDLRELTDHTCRVQMASYPYDG